MTRNPLNNLNLTACSQAIAQAPQRRVVDDLPFYLAWLLAGLILGLLLPGCTTAKPERLASPYSHRMIFAVAPLRNESGTQYADGVVMADKLTQELELVKGIIVLPVDRVLAAMAQLQIHQVSTPGDARALCRLLNADGVILGTITAYDSYDPPKIGVMVELHMADANAAAPDTLAAVRRMADQPAAGQSGLNAGATSGGGGNPVAIVSHYFDAGDANTRDEMQRFALTRGATNNDRAIIRLYRIDMHRYEVFVSYATIARLMWVENIRTHPKPDKNKPKPADATVASSQR